MQENPIYDSINTNCKGVVYLKIKGSLFKFIIIFILIMSVFTGCSLEEASSYNAELNSQNKLLVHYIDVGQADSILVQVNGKNMLIDAGNKADGDKIVSYLQKQRVKKLDYVIATHPHEDHIGGMSAVLNKFTVEDFYAPKKTAATRAFENMVKALDGKKIKTAFAGVKLDLGEDVNCEIIAPNSKDYKEINNYSAVIKLDYKDNKFLFTGDAESLSEEEIIKSNIDISSDVLKIGHHGSSSSTSSDFLDKVSPEIAIISTGKNNDYGHPHKETLSALKKRNITIYRTDIDGTVVLSSDGTKIKKE